MTRFVLQIIAGMVGLWLAVEFVPGVEFIGRTEVLLLAGLILGLVNVFIKPILNLISLPLRLLTLGLFSLVINMAMVWLVDCVFTELVIDGIIPLFWTTLIVWFLYLFIPKLFSKRKPIIE